MCSFALPLKLMNKNIENCGETSAYGVLTIDICT